MPYLGQAPTKGDENNFKILDNISSYTLTFDGSDAAVVSAANDTITSLNHRFVQGQRVTYNKGGGTVITGLSDGVYYIIKNDHNTIKLATSASNASNGTAVNITGVGAGSSHTLNVAFDGVNTKFKATHTNGQKAKITRSAQLVISINGVIQQPHDSATPSTGFGFDLDGTIVFSQAPASTDAYWAHVLTNNNVTFDISDNDVDNFTGNAITVSFNLSKTPPDNRNILVTIDGVVQYPNDPDGTVRAYNVVENVLTFTTAPVAGAEIQVRHIGFAGSSSGSGGSGVTNFYGRTGSVVLKNTDNIVANNAEFAGNLTVQGTMTTLDTKLTEVDQLEVAANNTTVGVAITQSGSGDILNLYDGSTEVFSVADGGKVDILSTNNLLTLKKATNGNYCGLELDRDNSGTEGGTIGLAGGTGHFITSAKIHDLTIRSANGNILFGSGQTEVLRTNPFGAKVTGILTATTFVGNGDFVDIDVDGRADLDDVVITGVTTTTNMVEITGALFDEGANLTLRNTTAINNDENIANINVAANDGPSGFHTGAQIKFQSGANWSDGATWTDIIFKHAKRASGTALVEGIKISGTTSNVSSHVSIGSSALSNAGNYYFAIKGYERSSQGASGDTVNLGIFNQSGAVEATANIDFRLGQAAVSNTPAARLLAGKSGGWTNTASTRDGYFAISVANNAQLSEHFRINKYGFVGIGTDNPTDILDINSDSASAVTNMYLRNHATLGGAALNLWTQGTYSSPTYKAIVGCSDLGGNIRVGAVSNHDLLLLTNNDPKVTITTAGRVGINSLAPTSTLLVREPTNDNASITLYRPSTSVDIGAISWQTDSGIQAMINYRGTTPHGMQFYTGGTQFPDDLNMIIDMNGKVCISHSSALHSGNLQVSTSSADAIDINAYSSTAANGGRLTFYRSKNATIGSNTIVADNDSLGRIDFRGYNTNGNAYNIGATIEAEVDGSVNSSTDMPSAIVLKTSADGSASPTERLRITSDGAVQIGNLQTSQNSTTHTSATKLHIDSTKSIKIARLAAGNITSAGWFTVAKVAASNGNYFKCYASIGGDFTQDMCVMELTASFSASGALQNTYTEPVFKAYRTGAHSTDRITRARLVKDGSNLLYLQIYIAGGVNSNTFGKSVLEYQIGAYSQNTADSGSAAMFETQASGLTGLRTLEVDDNAICVNAGSHKFYSGGNATERLTIKSNGAVVIPDSTQGLRFGSATSQDFALYHSGANSHIEHFGDGNLFIDYNNNFNLRFFRTSPTDVREALTITNGVAANPEFIIKSNPTSASVNSGTHSPEVRFKGAGWNTSSGSTEVGTKLQSEHYYWTGSYSNTFGQTYPDFKIKMKNSDSNSYVEKFAFSGNGVMRLQSGGGINFHNYGSGSGVTSNTLDDYEEGSWTPTFPTGDGSQTIGTHNATYTKVGRMVYAFLYMQNGGQAPNNGTIWQIGGLPFAANSANGLTHHGFGNIAYTAAYNYSVWRPLVTTNSRIYFHRVDGSNSVLNNSDVRSLGMSHFIIGVVYTTDS